MDRDLCTWGHPQLRAWLVHHIGPPLHQCGLYQGWDRLGECGQYKPLSCCLASSVLARLLVLGYPVRPFLNPAWLGSSGVSQPWETTGQGGLHSGLTASPIAAASTHKLKLLTGITVTGPCCHVASTAAGHSFLPENFAFSPLPPLSPAPQQFRLHLEGQG